MKHPDLQGFDAEEQEEWLDALEGFEARRRSGGLCSAAKLGGAAYADRSEFAICGIDALSQYHSFDGRNADARRLVHGASYPQSDPLECLSHGSAGQSTSRRSGWAHLQFCFFCDTL